MHSERERKVKDFHLRIDHPVGSDLSENKTEEGTEESLSASRFLASLAKGLRTKGPSLQREGDSRVYRMHLMAEELSEVGTALADRDVVKLADALADLQYVLSGTAVAYGIPLGEVFEEVHRSNMTKTQDTEDGTGRFVGKGPGYVEPDIEGAMRRAVNRLDLDTTKLISEAYEVMTWLMKGIKHISVPDYGKLNRVLVNLESASRSQT